MICLVFFASERRYTEFALLTGVHSCVLPILEVAEVAQAAMQLGKPWAAIKAVTDTADEGSSRDFHANLVRAARSAAQAVERLVAMPGFGNFVAPQQQIR